MADGLAPEKTEALDIGRTASQRQFMQRLRADKWRRWATVSVAGRPRSLVALDDRRLDGLCGEDQGRVVRLTDIGLNALRAKIPLLN